MVLPPYPESNYFMSPEYLKGYQDGYDQAKRFMMDIIKGMKGLAEETGTISVRTEEV
jgi:hypothetical protein